MSLHPTTFQGENPEDQGIGWNDCATLHRRTDGGGLLHGFKVIRKGNFAELARSVAQFSPEERSHYMIEKAGDRQYLAHEIMALVKRPDFPLPAGA